MGTEIERRFMVYDSDKFRGLLESQENVKMVYKISQGYLRTSKPSVRVRCRRELMGEKRLEAFFCIKSSASGATRMEYEYPIDPPIDAKSILELCPNKIEKWRYVIHLGCNIWEIDIFKGSNKGLILAEIELSHIDQIFDRPYFIGNEITGEAEYSNSSLSMFPISMWPEPMQERLKDYAKH